MRETFRPYNKIIIIVDTNQHAVVLTDSSGGPIACNYVSVMTTSGGSAADQSFQIIPSGSNTLYGPTHVSGGVWDTLSALQYGLSGRDQGPSGYPNASARTSNSLSGVLGLYGNCDNDTLTLSLATHEAARSIIITQDGIVGKKYVVTYGQIKEANTRADNAVYPGEITYASGPGM